MGFFKLRRGVMGQAAILKRRRDDGWDGPPLLFAAGNNGTAVAYSVPDDLTVVWEVQGWSDHLLACATTPEGRSYWGGTGEELRAVTPDGQVDWALPMPGDIEGIDADADGVYVTGKGFFHHYDHDGNPLWTRSTGGWSGYDVAVFGEWVFLAESNGLRRHRKSDGGLDWSKSSNAQAVSVHPTLEHVYARHGNGGITARTVAGSSLWDSDPGGAGGVNDIVVTPEAIVGTHDDGDTGQFRMDFDGNIIWQQNPFWTSLDCITAEPGGRVFSSGQTRRPYEVDTGDGSRTGVNGPDTGEFIFALACAPGTWASYVEGWN
jgi:hypothetical protein